MVTRVVRVRARDVVGDTVMAYGRPAVVVQLLPREPGRPRTARATHDPPCRVCERRLQYDALHRQWRCPECRTTYPGKLTKGIDTGWNLWLSVYDNNKYKATRNHPVETHCTTEQLVFEGLGRRSVVGAFDGGRLTSDSGVLLLREADRLFDVTGRLAACFTDYRDPERVEHPLQILIAQRVLGLAVGYEDLNDHDRLRDDSALALATGCADVTGEQRLRERDRGHALAGSSTLNRLELGDPKTAKCHRYKKILADGGIIDDLLVDLFLDSERRPPAQVVLDLDATDDRLHGNQEGRFFHGYYGHYCYLPLYITCGEHVLRCRLRRADCDASDGAVEELTVIVAQIRQRWPETKILVRGDSGFCRESIMAWCEDNGVDYVLGLARNARLQRRIAKALRKSRRRSAASGKASRRFREFRYRTLDSWSRSRRVVAKAEWLPGTGGGNPRFVVTSLDRQTIAKQVLYEELYCARGDMENRIKEQQLWLFADRTSTATMRANQIRLYFSAFAGILLTILRRVGLQGTELANARFDTIRARLIKLAGRIKVSVRRVRISLSSVYPLQELFAQALTALRAAPVCVAPVRDAPG